MSLINKAKNYFKDKLDSISQIDTNWSNRPYDFYLIFGQNETDKLPWIKSNWDKIFQPYFNSLLVQAENSNQTGIRVDKYRAEKRLAKKDAKEFTYHSEIKLGRLKWDEKSHNKWTSQDTVEYYFQGFELWTPIWTVCDKKDTPPDIFISISNENDFENKRHIQFGYLIVIAVAKNLKINSKTIIKELSEKINAKATVLKDRKWGKTEKVGKWTFVNWIQDTFSNGIYMGQNLHSFDFNELEFGKAWEVVYSQK